MEPLSKSDKDLHANDGLMLADASIRGSGVAQEMMQLQMLESQVLRSYSAPGLPRNVPEVEWVRNTLDGSILHDHKGYPVSVNRILATKPLRSELSSRPGPGGKKLTYLSGEGVTRTLNDIFGFDGWNLEIVKTQREECVRDDRGRYHVAYTAHVRLTHKNSGTYKEDVGASDSVDKIMGTAVANALKGSITDALKRSARHFGEKLGNTLYQGDFSISKAPLTLRDALDQYDKESSTKFGSATKKTATKMNSDTTNISGKGVNKNTEPSNISTSTTNNCVGVGANSYPCEQPGTAPNIQKNRAPQGQAPPKHNGCTRNSLGSMATTAKTPSHNIQMASANVHPVVSATPAAKKLATNIIETKESLSSRLGPTPKLQLPSSSNQSVSLISSSHLGNNANGTNPPLSASDRLNQSNMFGVSVSNSDKENASQNGQQQIAGMQMGRPGTSNGRKSDPSEVEWARPHAGLTKRPFNHVDSSVVMSVPNKKMNANPYCKN